MAETPPYTNDTLRWVAADIRYPPIDDFAAGVPAALRARIQPEFPIPEENNELTVAVGPAGPTAQQVMRHRFVRRDRFMCVTIGRDGVTLEATEYNGWIRFKAVIVEFLRAVEETMRPAGVLRVGLRYIDEIRLPAGPATFADWTGWIDDRLVAPLLLEGVESLTNGTVVLQYGQAPGFVTLFRAAPFAAGRTVQQEGVLRMPAETPDGPYFLLDTDASWADPDRQVPEFESSRVAGIFDTLHLPCKQLYEASITDRLRSDVLMRPRAEVAST